MPSSLVFALKTAGWVVLFAVGFVVIRFAGEVVFFLPGAVAKRLSFVLTGSDDGPLTSLFFYLVAAIFVLTLAGISWGIILLDRWLDGRRQKPGSREPSNR